MPTIERSTPESGLFTRDEAPVPLAGVSIEAEISSFCARVAVTQRYVNREATPIEAVYVFPLDDGAAVCGFEAIVDDTVVVGEVLERDKAFDMYDSAMERGDGAFLLDVERPDVFQASVGNLPPGKEALLRLTYVTELSVAGEGLRFSIPTTVSPRYAPAEDHAGVGRPDSEALNPPRGWSVPYGLTLSVRLAMPGAISRIESPSHPVSVATDGHEATVTLAQREAALDRDFVLSVETIGLDAPQAWIERGNDDEDAVAVAFVPRLGHDSRPAEVIFLVDRSGSMGGSSIEETRNALQLCLRSMIAGCHFNIVGFGSRYEALFPSSREYDESSLKAASDHVAALHADLGGTEILPALTFVLEQERIGSLVRQVVVLTDGEVTNTDAVLALARQHAAHSRVFTFGIGAGASHHLVRGLARAGGGAAEFIFPGERIERKVVRQFGRLLSPALTDVRVEWGGLDVTQAPTEVPPVFADGRVLVYGLVTGGEARLGPGTTNVKVRLTAVAPPGPVSFDVPVDLAHARAGRTVAPLAARARIRELEESPEWTLMRGSRQRDRKSTAIAQEIVGLSVRYGVISRETSFVAVERRDVPLTGDLKLRRVPIALTSGWGGLQATPMLMPARASLADTQAVVASFGAHASIEDVPPSAGGWFSRPFSGRSRASQRTTSSLEHRAESPAMPRHGRRSGTRSTPSPVPAGMHELVALQRADGSWDLTPALAAVLGHELADLEAALAGATGSRDDARRAWATALALVWLREHARDAGDEWRLLGAKARRWLDDVQAAPAGRLPWLEAAAHLVVGGP